MADLGYSRKFLVIIDDSPDCDRAVTFAAHRVKRTGGTLVLMSVIDSADFDQFIGVADTMRAEARNEAERNLDARIARIAQIGQIRTESVIREGALDAAIEGVLRRAIRRSRSSSSRRARRTRDPVRWSCISLATGGSISS